MKPSRHIPSAILLFLVSASQSLLAQPQTTTGGIALTHASPVTLRAGSSHIVQAPWRIKRISVTNPDVADVQALEPRNILIQGRSIGATDIFLWSEDEKAWKLQVDVIADLRQLQQALGKLFPGSDLDLTQSGEVVVVSGSLPRATDTEKLPAFFDATGLTYVDRTSLAGVQQVQIQVRVAEVSRTAIKTLGVNAFGVGEDAFGGLTIGPDGGGALNPVGIGVPEGALATPDLPFFFPNDVVPSSAVTLFGGLVDENVMAFVQALSENQFLRILAEPTLVAASGEEASFLAGGEFPIPVAQGTSDSTSITIVYKEFGVRLNFQPTVLGEGGIRLRVRPEVSELTETGAVEVSGFRVPGLVTRRADTTLELKSGQTFAMAGLLSNSEETRRSRVPVIGDLPIIGALFRSVRYVKGETELVVLVTASLVEPMSLAGRSPLPGTVAETESDWEVFVEGAATTGQFSTAAATPSGPAVIQSLGLDRLRGPGAWANHDSNRATPSIPASRQSD